MNPGGEREKLSWTASTSAPDSSREEGAVGVRALRLEDLNVAFQPIVDLGKGEVFGHEALVRCRKPEYSDPRTLVELAVKEDAFGRLGRMIRDLAFTRCGDVPLFVNLHPAELVARWVVRPDDPIGFHSQPVYLEIPESATFTHFDLCTSVLKELCVRTGARLVIDDFAAAYSVDKLVQLAPAVVKLDIAVTRDIQKHPLQQAVASELVTLCKQIGARASGEGVETVEELKCLQNLGVELAQGFLFARPAARPPIPSWPTGTRPVPFLPTSKKGH
jgi:EAL domain-containing protein (putative c-di-GMP-specific phosphodiesterase class I)